MSGTKTGLAKKKNVSNQVGHSQQKRSDAALLAQIPSDLGGFDDEKFSLLESYVYRTGQRSEPSLLQQSEARAESMRKLRSGVYQDVKSLMNGYRSYSRVRDMYLEEMMERAEHETEGAYMDAPSADESPFEQLAQRLEIMDAVEERKFKRTYQPYIETGRRIDLALKAVDFGISKMKNRALADFLKYVYIDGEDKPRVADATKHFDISTTSFYNMRDKAISELTRMMFGSADKSSKRELHAIIAWLSYENNEELFGEALFEFLA